MAEDSDRSAPAVALPRRRRSGAGASSCPICGRPPAAATRPFCSRRCADVDLHRWLGGVYRVESDEQQEPGEEPPPRMPDRR